MPDMISPLEYGIFLIGSIGCIIYGVMVLIVKIFSRPKG